MSVWEEAMVSDESYNEKDEIAYFSEYLLLQDYEDEVVWLCPIYSHVWTAEEPISIIVK